MKNTNKDLDKSIQIYHKSRNLDTLLAEIDKGFSPQFLFFWKHHPQQDGVIDNSCLSQWWPSPFEYSGQKYPTAEHFMMAQKALLFNDQEIFQKILKAPSPKEVKTLGRSVKGFNETIWKENRYNIVLRGNLAKFAQNKHLEEFLLGTFGSILVEASPYDKVWGIGLTEEDPRAQNPKKWQGQNLLGFALMEARVWLLD